MKSFKCFTKIEKISIESISFLEFRKIFNNKNPPTDNEIMKTAKASHLGFSSKFPQCIKQKRHFQPLTYATYIILF